MYCILFMTINMNNTVRDYIRLGKESIELGSMPRFKMVYKDIQEFVHDTHANINLEYIFTQLFNKACLDSQQDFICLLITIYFENMNSISQIALRQHFFYGKHIIKNKKVRNWYDMYVLPMFQ